MPYYESSWPSYDQEMAELWQKSLNEKVDLLNNAPAGQSLKGENNFLNYIIHKDQVLFSGIYSTIYACSNPQQAIDCPLMCRIYQPNSKIQPETDIYLRILRVIGNNSPYIISTLDIFYDETHHIYLFQELANRGNSLEYLRAGNYVQPKQMMRWASNIWQAMDYLGSNAIVHCNIRPKHILLKSSANGQLTAKLSSFRDAITYWDPNKNDIIHLPKRDSPIQYANFQAPESYKQPGNNNQNQTETYNPVMADVWSFGATFFYLVTRMYPFDLNKASDLTVIQADIDNRILTSTVLTPQNKSWFDSLLKVDHEKRCRFGDILIENEN